MVKIHAVCTQCGNSIDMFDTKKEMRYHIAKLKKCEHCEAPFQFLPDGKIWNVRYETFEFEDNEATGDVNFWKNIQFMYLS